ncbi:MAG: 50S ribosomal protein P1 [Candidatus Aenigmatarchaeota archaeon]
MNLVYAALMLHSADKEVSTENLEKVVDAIGVDVEEAEIKALVSALEDVDIDEAMEKAAVPSAAPAQPTGGAAGEEESEEEESAEEEEEDDEGEEEAAEGMESLF